MQRPEIRIIQDQQTEINPVEVSGWEAEQLLRKYGHTPQTFSTRENESGQQENSGLSFEEMVNQEELRIKEEEMRRYSKINGPRPTTFDGGRGYDSEVKYGSDEETGFGYKIQIVSDMPLPKK
jgi:hypothetical protein